MRVGRQDRVTLGQNGAGFAVKSGKMQAKRWVFLGAVSPRDPTAFAAQCSRMYRSTIAGPLSASLSLRTTLPLQPSPRTHARHARGGRAGARLRLLTACQMLDLASGSCPERASAPVYGCCRGQPRQFRDLIWSGGRGSLDRLDELGAEENHRKMDRSRDNPYKVLCTQRGAAGKCHKGRHSSR